ncbi:MAG: flagellar basal body P-ring protein FlgI [bacterium]|jgi:flagellar P-ring protein precursor FlgI
MRRAIAILLLAAAGAQGAARIKELVSIEGVRENQLVGYGLVVGLAGTGDRRQTYFSTQSLANMLARMGVQVPASAIRVNNVAAVMVTASLPAFAQPGMRFDVTAAATGDATSLQGGILLMTPLLGADGRTYAVAQGPVVTGGFVAGRSGTQQTVNHPTVGRVPGGATVEVAAPTPAPGREFRLQLRQPDFTTAARIAEAINKKFAPGAARAEHSALVTITVPEEWDARTPEFVAAIEALTVETDRLAKVVVNERTGTIVMGRDVHISPAAIMHGNLTVEIETSQVVSQPAPFSGGTTEIVPQVSVGVREERARDIVLKQGATVEELVRALNAIGSTPRDIIAILQALRNAGALEAELEVL